MTTVSRTQLDDLARQNCIQPYALGDDLLGCNLQDIQDFLQESNNYCFTQEHGLCKQDIDRYVEIKNLFSKTKSATTIPSTYDNIVVYAKDGKNIFHNHAMLEPCNYNNIGWHYCEHASAHFIDINLALIGGGAFAKVNSNDLEYIGQTTRTIWTWGHCGACANGGIYITVIVNNYRLVTNREFITWAVSYDTNAEQGDYKFFIRKVNSHSNAMDTAFRTRKGLRTWLKERNLRIGKKWSWGTTHKIIGDFDTTSFMSTKEYKDNMPTTAQEFLITDNGRVTKAYMNGITLCYCNCNVHDRYEENRVLNY